MIGYWCFKLVFWDIGILFVLVSYSWCLIWCFGVIVRYSVLFRAGVTLGVYYSYYYYIILLYLIYHTILFLYSHSQSFTALIHKHPIILYVSVFIWLGRYRWGFHPRLVFEVRISDRFEVCLLVIGYLCFGNSGVWGCWRVFSVSEELKKSKVFL